MALKKRKQKLDVGYEDPAERAQRKLEDELTGANLIDREITVLDRRLRRHGKGPISAEPQAYPFGIDDAQQLTVKSERSRLRIVMITADPTVCVEGSPSQEQYKAYAALFDELHVIVMTRRTHGFAESKRINETFWIYPTDSLNWLFSIYDAYRIGTTQLSFAAGFRADLIVTHDLYEAGLAGYLLARHVGRPLQSHLYRNPFDPYLAEGGFLNRVRIFIARFLVTRVESIRTISERIRTAVISRGAFNEFVTVLPLYRDLRLFRDAKPAFQLEERYPQFQLFFLVVGPLTYDRHVSFVVDVCAYTLRRYPSVGLVIVGEGPEKKRLMEKVEREGLAHKVVFESESGETISHMKGADLLVNPTSGDDVDETLAEAAAAGLPVLTAEGGLADALFVDGESGFVCPEANSVCFQARIGQFLSDNLLRKTFSINARDRVFATIEQDTTAYLNTYQALMEESVLQYYQMREETSEEEPEYEAAEEEAPERGEAEQTENEQTQA